MQEVADELNTDLEKYKLDTILRRAHFFAQVREEAGSHLKASEENLNYLPEKLKSLFRYYKKNPEEALNDGRSVCKKTGKITRLANQENIANKAYGNREGNGPPSTGDGWLYRGRGIFQLTGKNNYTKFENEYQNYWGTPSPNFIKNPGEIKNFPYDVRSAVWYWASNSIQTIADEGSSEDVVEKVTFKINIGKANLKERKSNFTNLTYPAFK
ncbi:hypothetical protein RGU70_11140 [Herbaspirillum sp. RTI4]|uniref:glycoside hydrolase family 19 protein n=1 Tax=Herbaspirillum sp. RTI4 TaxID=3048640 RepID=UPI002AB376E2|nr:hypothetical protein [Herbaspirillum sp. RTI4]MDY7578874.1 hypothetical protein [Herbaspirillum sp. RTI4]